jgi:ParB family transcriptional regulator, chromosome partitioning protein
MARKNLLNFSELPPGNSGDEAEQEPPITAFQGMGVGGKLTRSLDDLAAKANAAKELEARLTAGQTIIDLEPALLDPSFITDRMEDADDSYRRLLQSIETRGQDSPILVRPNPTDPGRYQIAFGHRRWRAARDLRRPVRSVVRNLTDQELIIAQGQENSARENLSFIERARFAKGLAELGYDRDVIMAALATDKTNVSRLLSVANLIPADLIAAIGPAPNIGRDRWTVLANHFTPENKDSAAGYALIFANDDFARLPSDERFNKSLITIDRQKAAAAGKGRGGRNGARKERREWSPNGGNAVAILTQQSRSSSLTIDTRIAPGFDEFILGAMQRLYEEFRRTVESKPATLRRR